MKKHVPKSHYDVIVAVNMSNHAMRASLTFLVSLYALSVLFCYMAGVFCRQILIDALHRESIATSSSNQQMKRPLSIRIESDGSQVVEENDEDEDEDMLEGEQVLVDISYVDGRFLNSRTRISEAIEAVMEDITFLNCQPRKQTGWSCTAIGNGGTRLTLTTWPVDGVVSLEAFLPTSSYGEIDDLRRNIEGAFAVAPPRNFAQVDVMEPYTFWTVRHRGHPSGSDIDREMDGVWKERVGSVQTPFQRIEVYDYIRSRFGIHTFNRARQPGTYENENPFLFQPNRKVYLDGVLQSSLFGEAAYHEALVHPAMVSHPDPKRVLIIGGGEGATLREALKHNTVDKVTMVEIDELMVQTSRKYIPFWSDCSHIQDSAESCFEDPRAELFCEDAIAWIFNRFGESPSIKTDKYDVIIMDALDPDTVVAFSDVLYDNPAFVRALTDALTDNGIFLMQTGQAADYTEIPVEYFADKSYEILVVNHFRDQGMVNVKGYEEGSCGFGYPWSYTILFKAQAERERWFRNEAEINLDLFKRSRKTVDGASPFRYFDGATMMYLQYASRRDADSSCLQGMIPQPCGESSFERSSMVDTSSYEVVESGNVTTTVDITKGSFVGADEAVHAIHVPTATETFLQSVSRLSPRVAKFFNATLELSQVEHWRGEKSRFLDVDWRLPHLPLGPIDTIPQGFDVDDREAWALRAVRSRTARMDIGSG